ncbi:lipase family protein [Patulibacter minatonensis]|uniref:lipase family protein n=1 Tax=Patulibacter minatonensis TaxID=298163 RepID=UPI0006848915|nr:lipase family protein [Patulibacter minatonensis]
MRGSWWCRAARLLAASVVLSVLGLGALATGTAAAAPPPPPDDPFFVPPASFADATPGTVLRTRDADLSVLVVPLTGIAFTAKQALYRTTDAQGRPAVSVMTLILPKAAPPAAGRSLLSYQAAEDSLDPSCAPSYQLQTGATGTPDLVTSVVALVSQLGRGGAVVVPDHEGPDSQLMVRATEGHAVLDGIRAAEQLPGTGLRGRATKVALMGYSGGAHATASALELQAAYAPELDIVGAAAGGVPTLDAASIRGLDGSLGSGLVLPILTALERAYPELSLDPLLNDHGRAHRQRTRTGCAVTVFSAPFGRLADFTAVPDVLAVPRVARIVDRNALGGAAPVAPTLVYNAIQDDLIKIAPVDVLVDRWCAAGANVTYVRDPLGIEHTVAGGAFIVTALQFLDARLDGTPVPSGCTRSRTAPSAPATPATCTSRRRITIRPRVPRHATVRRIRVSVAGARPRTLQGRRTRVVVDLRGRAEARVRVVLRVDSVRRGMRLRTVDRRVYRTCGRNR